MARFARTFARCAFGIAFAMVLVGHAVPTRGEGPTRHVLAIYTSSHGISLFDEFHEGLLGALRDSSDPRVEIHAEYFDAMIDRGEAYEAAVAEYLRQKYAGIRIDVVVGVSAPAVRFAARIRETIFPDAALVFGGVDRRVLETGLVAPGTPGVTVFIDIRKTVELAIRCQPGTKRVAFVLGASEFERTWNSRLVSEIGAADPGLEVIDLSGLDADVLLQRLSTLPDHTFVLWGSFFRDGIGASYSPRDILSRACAASTAPIYGVFEEYLGLGIVGGSLTSYADNGARTGELLLHTLRGESPGASGAVHASDNIVAFDARQLDRWEIPENRLPAGAIVKYREPTVWDLYGWYIIGAIALILAQALLIAGLLVQRSRRLAAQAEVEGQFAFERLVSELSTRLSEAAPDAVDAVIASAIESARGLFGADRLSLLQFAGVDGRADVQHSSVADGVAPLGSEVAFEVYPEIVERLRLGQSVVRIGKPTDVAASMPSTREALERAGIVSVSAVPIHIGGEALGVLSMVSTRAEAVWNEDAVARLQILADIIANAIGRRTATEQVRKSEELSHAVLGSLSAQVCVIDRDGRVVAGNDAWQRAVPDSGADVACALMRKNCGVDCGTASECTSSDSVHARDGIRSVISGESPSFSMEYRLAQTVGDTWHVVTVERLRLPEGGAVVSNLNVTARKRAELEAEQRRQELTHFSRVSAMGELAASLAHELNQPLTGVLTNAQAAVRYLDVDPPNLAEVREILDDIIEDDRRAGEVIRRLRSMLQSGAVESAEVDLNDVVTNVVKLIASDAILRDVTIVTDLAPDLARVVGDRIQMQQVVLNLIVNAMDAMRSESVRRVTVRTDADGSNGVLLSVSDTGPGIEHDRLGKVFQPFFTTKSDGLGMGLSIARTIVEAHGGVLWAVNNPDRGASFLFKLPGSKTAAVSA